MKILLDTCVIIDFLCKRDGYEASKKVIEYCSKNKCGYITAKAVCDIYYILHQHYHSDAETRNKIENLLILFNLLDTTKSDIKEALASETKDYEDAVMIETARNNQADIIVTDNIKDYMQQKDIKVFHPDTFVSDIIGKDSSRKSDKQLRGKKFFEDYYGKPYSEITQDDLGPCEEIDWGEDIGGEIIED
ncbi:MAG: putative toxin-antitoxin system toxin component, PIN family [Lachnospiraceae bacterium]|nr:putative toxin-antitoxin system toxin component, PIN family [Lachnospiraceae bacterium]